MTNWIENQITNLHKAASAPIAATRDTAKQEKKVK